MLGTVKKHTSRFGHQPVHCKFSLTVDSMTFPKNCSVSDQAILSLYHERKAKLAHTGNFVYSKVSSLNEVVIPVGERLELDAVLYKDLRSNRYQTKTSKLALRELVKKGVLGQYGYRDVGKCNLNLHEIVQEMGYELSCTKNGMVLFENLKGVVIRFSITAAIQKIESSSRYLREDFDELSSNSGISDITEATLLTNSMGGGKKERVPTSNPLYGVPTPSTAVPTNLTAAQTSNERSEEEKSDCGHSDLNNDIPIGEPDDTPSDSTPTAAASSDTSSPAVSAASDHATGVETVDQLPPHPTASAARAASTQDAYNLYDQHLKNKMLLIHRLERSLAQQTAHRTAEVAALRAELATTAAALRKEQIVRATIADVTSRGDDLLAAALSDARDKAARACAECATTAEELRAVWAEKALLQEQVVQLREQQAQEMELSRQAAAVAASAAVRRADAEEEAQQLVLQLINVKMDHANMALELDAATRSNDQLRRRLSVYAKEIKALQARCLQLSPAALL